MRIYKPNEDDDSQLKHKKEIEKWRNRFLIALIFAIPSFVIMIIVWFPAGEKEFDKNFLGIQGLSWKAVVLGLLAAPVQFWLSKGFYVKAVKSLRHLSPSMEVLIIMGTSAAFLYSFFATIYRMTQPPNTFKGEVYFETSTLLLTFVLLGRYLENKAKGKTSNAITKLLKLKSTTARLIESKKTSSGKLREVERMIDIDLV